MKHLTLAFLLALAPLGWGEDELVLYCVRESANHWEWEKQKQNYEGTGLTYVSSPEMRFTLKASKDSVLVKGLKNLEEDLIDHPFNVQSFIVQPVPNMVGGGTSYAFTAYSGVLYTYELAVRGTSSGGFFYRIIKKTSLNFEMFTEFGTCTKF